MSLRNLLLNAFLFTIICTLCSCRGSRRSPFPNQTAAPQPASYPNPIVEKPQPQAQSNPASSPNPIAEKPQPQAQSNPQPVVLPPPPPPVAYHLSDVAATHPGAEEKREFALNTVPPFDEIAAWNRLQSEELPQAEKALAASQGWHQLSQRFGSRWGTLTIVHGSYFGTLKFVHEGTVEFQETGLMWQQGDDGKERKWVDAVVYCRDLTLGGFSDWRLPSLEELKTLIVKGTDTTIDTSLFPGNYSCRHTYDSSHYYWSTTAGSTKSHALRMQFCYSSDNDGYKPDIGDVRCVRGGLVIQKFGFLDLGKSVVDQYTGLEWQKNPGKEMTWSESEAYCESLSLGRKSDWRLPDIYDLQSLWYSTQTDTGMLKIILWNMPYWSGSVEFESLERVMTVYFYNDSRGYCRSDCTNYVRCVRDGK